MNLSQRLLRLLNPRVLLLAMILLEFAYFAAIEWTGRVPDPSKLPSLTLYTVLVGALVVLFPSALVARLERWQVALAQSNLRALIFLGAVFLITGTVYASQHSAAFDEDPLFAASRIAADEGVTSLLAQYPSITWLGFQHPPLVPLLDGFVVHLLGADILWIRLVSLGFAFGTLIVTFFLGAKLYNNEIGLLAAAMLMSFTHVYRVGTAGTVDFIVAFFFVLALLLTTQLQASPSYKTAVAIGIVIAVGLLTKYTMVFVFPVLMGYVFLFRSFRRLWRYLALIALISLSALAVWVAVAYQIGVFALQIRTLSGYAQIATGTAQGWRFALEGLFVRLPAALGAYSVPVLLMGVFSFLQARGRVDKFVLFWIAAVFVPVAITLPDPRYFIPIFPALAIVGARGLTSIRPAAAQIILLGWLYCAAVMYLYVDWDRNVLLIPF